MVDMTCINKNYGYAIRDACVEDNDGNPTCEVVLNAKEDYIILKADTIVKTKPMCDFIVFRLRPKGRPILIEMKGKSLNVEDAKEQLINGSKLAVRIARQCFDDWSPNLFHVVLVCQEWDTVKHRMVADDFLKLSGKKHRVLTGECGNKLSIITKAIS